MFFAREISALSAHILALTYFLAFIQCFLSAKTSPWSTTSTRAITNRRRRCARSLFKIAVSASPWPDSTTYWPVLRRLSHPKGLVRRLAPRSPLVLCTILLLSWVQLSQSPALQSTINSLHSAFCILCSRPRSACSSRTSSCGRSRPQLAFISYPQHVILHPKALLASCQYPASSSCSPILIIA